MIWHPLSIAVIALDALALGFALYAAQTHIRVLISWEPESSAARQVALEGAVDGSSIATRFCIAFSCAASLLLILGISLLLPPLVSGAMCGTGVLTAMGPTGWRTLALRGIVLLLLWVWRTLDGVNRAHHRPPAVPLIARWQLLAVPLIGLASINTLGLLRRLDPHKAVDCCQVVYDTFRSLGGAKTTSGLSDSTWLGGAGVGAALVSALALWNLLQLRRRGELSPPPPRDWPLLAAVALWLPTATVALVTVLAAYHYEVLHHHCPWCLFLPQHAAVGYPLFGALLLIALETCAFAAAGRLGRMVPALAPGACRRQRRALLSLLVGLAVFVALTAGPALHWRLMHGVWMH